MSDDLEKFHHELYQEVLAYADAYGVFVEDAFFDVVNEYLIEVGELETADRAPYLGTRGVRIDGYGGDPRQCSNVLTLLILDVNQDDQVGRLNATELNAINNRAKNFVVKSLDEDFRHGLPASSAAAGLTDLISATWEKVEKVRILLLSNRVLSTRVDGAPAGEVDGVPITYNVWDLVRLERYVRGGREREEIEVDLVEDFPDPLPALRANVGGATYDGYLVVVPGAQLAAIYDRYSTRLLEQNVRVFLQARGAVNRGIKNTLDNERDMFFAYNNGISATAEDVTVQRGSDGLQITRIKNLQIVNGGQTTASIHAASLRKADLTGVFVQMKLSIVDPDRSMEIVPRISEYANSQNKVSAADFFSNHPFHVRIEQFSRRTYAPSPDGAFRESKWFYERARGQYNDARAGLTVAKRREFDLEYPKSQLLAKTDLSKFSLVWDGVPHIVGRGAQKHFAYFAQEIAKQWERDETQFSEVYFKQAMAKAIVFRRLESLVPKQSWYDGGYRANVVAYSIAKLAHDLERRGREFDFMAVWRTQDVPDAVERNLLHVAPMVLDVLQNPKGGRANVTEWAKHEHCWEEVKALRVDWPSPLGESAVGAAAAAQLLRDGARDQKLVNGIQAQTLVVNAGGMFWQDVLRWARDRRILSPKESTILNVCGSMPSRVPSEAQSAAAMAAYERLKVHGLPYELPR
ncbi:MAG: AIPR family protein [Sporichthyaceae bacterium]